MEHITSRKNRIIVHFRNLGSDRSYRRGAGTYLCDGEKLLHEALRFGAQVQTVLFTETCDITLPEDVQAYSVPKDLMEYVSPLKNSRGPIFSVKIPEITADEFTNAIVLENVQDPGNVGTVIRTANAFGIGAVILIGDCADPYNFKTVRSAMGALFRQQVLSMQLEEAVACFANRGMKLYGAALSETAMDIRKVQLHDAAVAIGSEGRGLSAQMLQACDGQIIIPILPHSESLNAAVAAGVAMWEMNGGVLPCPC